MSKFQNVHFRTVGEFLDYLPEHELAIVEPLRELILSTIPDVREKLAYNVPFYYRHKRLCYLWPSSVPWGKTRPETVQLGFCYGHLLQDDLNYLKRETVSRCTSRRSPGCRTSISIW